MNTLREETRVRWRSNTYVEQGVHVDPAPCTLPWIPWEDYMEAQLLETTPGEVGRIRVRFPPDGREDTLHCHPISDRVITVFAGSGVFIALRNGKEVRHELQHGDRVWMPRNTIHTFCAGPQGMFVESLHNPWVPLEDPRSLVYPR